MFVRAAKVAFEKTWAELGYETKYGDYSGKELEACRSVLRQAHSELQESISEFPPATLTRKFTSAYFQAENTSQSNATRKITPNPAGSGRDTRAIQSKLHLTQ
jgi:hypothetical protein